MISQFLHSGRFFHWGYQNLGIFLVSTGPISGIFLPGVVLELLSFNRRAKFTLKSSKFIATKNQALKGFGEVPHL